MTVKQIPLIVEPYPEDYNGYKFITLIRYNDNDTLNIIDNFTNGTINSYVLDLCGPNNIKEELIIDIAYKWYETNFHNYPISLEFSKLGLADEFGKIYRSVPVDYVTRVIGILPEYKMKGVYKIRKRKKKNIPVGIEFIDKTLPDPLV